MSPDFKLGDYFIFDDVKPNSNVTAGKLYQVVRIVKEDVYVPQNWSTMTRTHFLFLDDYGHERDLYFFEMYARIVNYKQEIRRMKLEKIFV